MSARIVRLCPPRDALEASVRALAADKQGRCFLQWLLYQCNVSGDVFVAGQANAELYAAGREAERKLGRKVLDLIAASYPRTKIVEIEEEIHG